MKSSQAAVDLVVEFEVSSKETYIRRYQKPEWPGLQSGITIGIGYDLGYMTIDQITKDWSPHVSAAMVAAMHRCAGVRGGSAQNLLGWARQNISVPWEAAMAVFDESTVPRYEAMLLKVIPSADALPPDCFGVLFSLTYNRGASFANAGDRYLEMRQIRQHVTSGEWDKVPDDLRQMKRLWPSTPGLQRRRESEARLFEKGLQEQHQSAAEVVEAEPSNRVATGDEQDAPAEQDASVTPAGNTDLNVQPEQAQYSVEVEVIQRELRDLNYHEVGNIDGKFGGKLVAGIAAFMTDRGKDPNRGRITAELKDELSRAKTEGWSRPIAPARANATAKDIQDKVPAVKENWWQKLWAYILGTPAAAVALFKDWFGGFDDPASAVYKVKQFFLAIPAELYLLAIVAIAVAVFYKAKKSQDATVAAYRRGEIN